MVVTFTILHHDMYHTQQSREVKVHPVVLVPQVALDPMESKETVESLVARGLQGPKVLQVQLDSQDL